MDRQQEGQILFELLNEVGIINQLASAAFNKRMPHGLHVSQFSVVNHLIRTGDGSSPVQIANAMQVTKATMTHTLGILESLNFIRHEPNPNDKRSKLVFVTKKGREFQAKAITAIAPALGALIQLCDMEALANILPELRELRKILDDNRDL